MYLGGRDLRPEEKMKMTAVGRKTIKRYFGILFMSLGGAGLASPSQAAVLWSTEASGSARQFEITCGTCPNSVTDLSNQQDGGFGNLLANVHFSNGAKVNYDAIAAFTGPKSLPHLGVLAGADIEVVPPSTFFFAAGATARATQQYTYTGTTSENYTVQYDIDGTISGGILTEIAGGFTVFGRGFSPNQEVQPVIGLSFDHVNGDGTEKPVHLSGNVTFTANPGDIFFFQATLDAFADSRSQQLTAVADASHTLEMAFTQGDTSLLIPAGTSSASTVPEPGTSLLTAMGAAALVIGMRYRRAQT
jgi:hypothetical protein